MLLFILSVAQLSIAQTEEELNVKADAHFKNEEYVQATPLYLRLLSLQPRDHNYNYRYGTCLLFNSDKKQDAFKYLNYAAKGEDVEVEVFYFLGKAFHLTFEFNKAIQYYTKYKQVAGNRAAQNLDVDRQIEMAQNGKRLLSRISELIIESRKLTALNDFFRLYDLSNIGGTLLVTEEFQTKLDKKNNHVPLIHFPAKPTQIYYSSFGDDGNTGKDIYVRRKLPDGSWGKAQKIAGGVNTNYDEEFPYMHPNGRYLYFSSKGHNSMGGYDVFRAPYFPDDDSFGDPENLDFAISSPDDDLFYVVDSLDKNAFFASARQSQEGKIHVYKMRVQRSPDQMIILKGNFISKINPANKVISIQVKDVASGRRIGSYKSNSIDGGYIVTLPKGGKYEYTMQVQGEPDSYTEVFQAPFLTELKPLKQSIVEYEENGNIVVQIFNLFDEEIEDASDILAEVLKNKSQLQPNSDAFDLDALDRLENEKKLLADLNLDRYNTIELSDIAKTDLEKFTLAQKEIENELNKLLMVANNAIKSAHNADSIAESLIAEAKTVKNKAKANAILDQALAEKRTAQREIQKAEQALVLHEEMQKAKKLNEQNINNAAAVNNILKDVNSDNLKEKMNELATKQGEYIKRNFNASSGKSAAQELYSKTEEKTGLSSLNKTKNELLALEKAIQIRENEIKKLESEKEFAKKKELEDIERKIEQLSADNRADKELISIKQKEIERESIKENNAIAQKSAIDNTRDIADNEIRTDLSLQSVDNLINQFKTIGSQESVDAFEKSTNKLRESLNEQLTDSSDFLTDKYQESQNANESTNKTIQNEKQQDISSNKTSNSDVASKNETSELVSQLNRSLNAQEERVRLSSKSPEEKAKERLAIEKQWVVEISKEINRKENELKENPNSTVIIEEIEQLKKELSNKKAYIDELKPLGDPETKEEVIAKTSIQTANPNYYENKKNAERISNISDKLNALTNNDNELIKALNERKDNLSNVNSEDAITERKIIDSLITELESEVKERENMVVLLSDVGIDPLDDYSEADTSKDFRDVQFGGSTELKNLFEQSQVLKSTAQSLMDKEKQLEIQKELLSKSTNKLFEIDAALQKDPNNEELKAFKKGLEELMATVESEINITESSIEQLSDSKQRTSEVSEVSEVSQVNAIQREIEELSAQNANNETILAKQRELLKAIDKATEIVAKKLEKNPTDQQANDERNALQSAKEATLDAIAELEQALIAQQNDKSSNPSTTTISDKQVNTIQREIEELSAQNANNQTILTKQRELLKAIDKATEIVAKKLEKNPTDQQANDERNALKSAKEATLDAIAELEQALIAQQNDKSSNPSATTISDKQVNAIQLEIEELSAQNANDETILMKQRELLKAIDKATEIVAKKLEKNPTDQQANDERNALQSAKEATLDAIAELEQALIAQQNDKSSTPSATTISDKQVNAIQREIEELSAQNANNETILMKQRELLKAIDKATEIVAKKLEKNPTDQQANDERNALQSAKEATLDAIAELEQAELAKQQDGNTPTLSENEFISNSRKTNNVEDAFTISENTESEKLISARIALNTYLEKLKIEKNNSTDENRIKSIASEVNRTEEQIGLIDRWLSEMEFVYRPEEENGFVVSTNDDINTQQLKVAKLRSEINELERNLSSVDEKERKKLEKELSKLNEKLFNQEKALVIKQKDDLSSQSEKIIELQSNNDSEIGQANSVILTVKTEQTSEYIASLENSKKKNQDALAQKAIESRDELIEHQKQQRDQLERTNLMKEVIIGTNLSSSDINENFEKELTINTLKLERERIQLELTNLKRERQSASRKRIPIIDVEIANMTRQIERIDEKIQVLSNIELTSDDTKKISVLTEKPDSKEIINALDEASIISIAKDKGYKNLSNKINELQLLDHRLNNLEIQEANIRNALLNDIEKASIEKDEVQKSSIVASAKQKAQQLENTSEEIRQLKRVLSELNNEIISDPLFDDERKNMVIAMALEGVQPIRIKPTEPFYTGLNFNANSSSYSIDNPIPINPKMPDGLVYKVQVGAFSKPVPEDTFKEFNPISGEQINNGLVRYMVGVFAAKGEAYMAQNKVRSLGYSDAFVVAYCGGQRMTVAQADQLIKQGKCTPASQIRTEENTDYLATNNEEEEISMKKPKSTYNQAPNAAPALAIEDMRGLFFTVQVGVYNYPIPASRLYNISPLNTNLSDKGQIRYSTGRFDDIATAISRRNEVRQIGISDAFVTAYYNGVRISIAEARKLLEENGSGILYNNIDQEKDTSEEEGETTIVFKPKEDNRKPLDNQKIMRTGISTETYSYYPKRELEAIRKTGVWVYYDESSQRIKTIPSEEEIELLNNNSVASFDWTTTYNGYTVDTSKGLYHESIEALNLDKTVYELQVTWNNSMPQLLAGFMQNNVYTLQVLSADEIIFGAIDYQSKEEIKQILQKINGIEIKESIVKW